MKRDSGIGVKLVPILGLALLIPMVRLEHAGAAGQAARGASIEAEAKLNQSAAEKKIMQASKEMMEGRRMVLRAMKAEGLTRDRSFQDGSRLMAEGERNIQEGARMWSQKGELAQAEELLMGGSSKMMEGKDKLMRAIEKSDIDKLAQVKKGKQLLIEGTAKLLEAKNSLQQGQKTSTE